MTFDEAVEIGVYYPIETDDGVEYNINMEKAREHASALYYAELDAIDEAVLAAIEAGYLQLDFTIDEDGRLDTTYKVLSDAV